MSGYCKCMILAAIVTIAGVMATAQQSLGDVARKERARQKPQAAKVITNEEIPSVDTSEPVASADDKSDVADEDEKSADKPADKNKPSSTENRLKDVAGWKGKIAAQEGKVKAIDQEIIQMERDYKLRQSAFYADLGLKLRDPNKWNDEERKYKENLEAKQKTREAERTKLDDLREQARRAGVERVD